MLSLHIFNAYYLSFHQRQQIDAKYRTGSGQRDKDDYLSEVEQAACDFAGEEVSLGKIHISFPNNT
jgi:hypothetical protein